MAVCSLSSCEESTVQCWYLSSADNQRNWVCLQFVL